MMPDNFGKLPLPIICGECGHQHTHFVTRKEFEATTPQADTEVVKMILALILSEVALRHALLHLSDGKVDCAPILQALAAIAAATPEGPA